MKHVSNYKTQSMKFTDFLVVGANIFLLLLAYRFIIHFLDYRLKKKIIQEGFLSKEDLKLLFYWDKKKERFTLIKTALFTFFSGLGLLIIFLTGISPDQYLLMLTIMLISLSVTAVCAYIILLKYNNSKP